MKNYADTGVAVVGTGFMGPAHTEGLRRLGIRVEGICGSSAAKSQAAANSLGLPKGYATYADVLNDPAVDSVHITTPNKHHHQMTLDALAAGKHVLCEKPLAMTSVESAHLVQAAAQSGLHCGVNYNVRFYPLALEAGQRIKRGDLGAIHSVSGSYTQDWLLFADDYNWRVLAEEGGQLRALADIGTHWLDLVTSVTGLEVDAVFADLRTIHPVRNRPLGEVETFTSAGSVERQSVPITTEDQGAVLIRFKGGAQGVLWVSQAVAGRKNRLQFEIGGAQSSLAWDTDDANSLWIGSRTSPNQVLPKDASLMSAIAGAHTGYPGGHAEGYPDSFKQCFKAFYDAIRGESGSAPYPTFADGHREILLCEAISKSHQEERWISVGEIQ